MSIALKAVWTIERNLGSNLSLGEIADACQVSKFHLCRAFEARTGMPVMHYVRARRLSDAAAALAGGADDILALALDAGYGSHEAFTRAFGAQFDRTPETVRKQKSTEGLNMMTAGKIVDERSYDATSAHRFETAAAMTVVGLSEQQSFAWPGDNSWPVATLHERILRKHRSQGRRDSDLGHHGYGRWRGV